MNWRSGLHAKLFGSSSSCNRDICKQSVTVCDWCSRLDVWRHSNFSDRLLLKAEKSAAFFFEELLSEERRLKDSWEILPYLLSTGCRVFAFLGDQFYSLLLNCHGKFRSKIPLWLIILVGLPAKVQDLAVFFPVTKLKWYDLGSFPLMHPGWRPGAKTEVGPCWGFPNSLPNGFFGDLKSQWQKHMKNKHPNCSRTDVPSGNLT